MAFVEINEARHPDRQRTPDDRRQQDQKLAHGQQRAVARRLYYKRSWSMVTPLLDLDYAEALVYACPKAKAITGASTQTSTATRADQRVGFMGAGVQRGQVRR